MFVFVCVRVRTYIYVYICAEIACECMCVCVCVSVLNKTQPTHNRKTKINAHGEINLVNTFTNGDKNEIFYSLDSKSSNSNSNLAQRY